MKMLVHFSVFVIVMTLLMGALNSGAAPVTFEDSALLEAVSTQWEAATGLLLSSPPEDTELANPLFTALDAHGLGIASLAGLEACTALTDVNLALNHISDLNPVSGLTSLIHLDVGVGVTPWDYHGNEFDFLQTGNLITTIAPLAGLVNLERLSLMGNEGITDLEALRTMDSLSELWLASNPIADFSPLEDVADTLTFFGDINCGLKQSDLTIINGLTHLDGLCIYLEFNLTDISVLTDINPGTVFLLMMVPLTEAGVIANYTSVQSLVISMTWTAALPDLSGLTQLDLANFSDNELRDCPGLTGCTRLRSLNLGRNELTDITALSTCTGLEQLDLHENKLGDIQPLLDNPGISHLQQLNLEDNAFFQGTPFCNENQLDQLYALAPGVTVSHNADCSPAASLSISVNGMGSTKPEPGTHTVIRGVYTNVTAVPLSESGYAFVNWTGDVVSSNRVASVFMDTDKSITANFTPGDWTLTVNQTGWIYDYLTEPEPGVYSYLNGQVANVSIHFGGNSSAYFAGWSGDVSGFQRYLNIPMNANKTITANLVTSGYQLFLTIQGGEGAIDGFDGPGPFNYAAGANFELQAINWNPLYRFDHWEGDIGTEDPGNPILPVTMDANRHITAVFAEDSSILTIIIEGPGSTAPPGSSAPGAQYAFGASQTACIEALLGAGSAFAYWSGDIENNSTAGSGICVTMDRDRTITAHFSPPDWNLTMRTEGNGATNPAPGTYGFRNGARAAVSAQLIENGEAFSGWTGDVDSAQQNNPQTAVTMDRHRTITANFMPGDWTLTLSRTGPSASRLTPGTGAYAYLNGQTASINAGSNASAYFAGWTGDITSVNPSVEVVMERDMTATANFVSAGYVCTVNTNGYGWVNISGPHYFASGLEPTLKATPWIGHVFSHWSGDVPAGTDPAVSELPVLMDRDRAITANFTPRQNVLTLIIMGEGATIPAGALEPGLQYEFPEGERVNITAALGTGGWAFSHWSGDIGGINPANRDIQVTMNADRTVVANYVPAEWTLSLAYTGQGSISPPPGTYGFLDGADMEVAAGIYAGGDAFDHWEGLPGGVDIMDADARFQIHGNIAVTAVFTPGDYTLTTSIIGGGAAEYISHPTGVYAYMAGRNARLEARPAASTYWGGYSGDVNTYDFSCRLLMNDNKNVLIHLGTSGYTLTVQQNGGGNTQPSGTTRFMAGAMPTIHALDVGGYLFDHWTGQLSPGMDPTDRDPVVLMDQNRTLTANFVEADFYLYLQVIGNGTTDPAPELYWHRNGDAFTVTATPGGDFLFLQWQGNVPAGQDPASRTISGTIDQNVELIAVFVPESVTVPDLSGKTQAEAEAALAVLGLVLGEVTLEYSDTVSLGHVITQNPAAATSVVYGSIVSIVVSRGPCIAPVPNLLGLSQSEAEAALIAANLTLGAIAQENSDTVPEGHIISQDPVFGLSVACNTVVAVVISLGPVIEGEGEEGEFEGEAGCHTADQNCDGLVNLSELLRVIQFFNSGGYHCETGTEDGYAPGLVTDKGLQPLVWRQITKVDCFPHSSDYMPQDWLITLSELLRVIQFFNSGGYHYCPEDNTEDGFCPGVGAE